MEHTEAVRLHAAEKYLLGELTSAQREEYEEHYFDCFACAEELKASLAFMESAKQVARDRAPQSVEEKTSERNRGGWFAWLQPALAVPALAALLLFVLAAYQNTVTIPSLKQEAAQSAALKIVTHFSLMAVGARGESQMEIAVHPREEFALDVDFPVVPSATGFVGQIQDASGRVEFSQPVSLERAKSTVDVNVPGGSLQPGNYSFVVMAQSPDAGASGMQETKRLPFTVVFKP